MPAQSQIRVLGTVVAVAHALVVVCIPLAGGWSWLERLVLFAGDGLDFRDVYVLTPSTGSLKILVYLPVALLLGVLMRVTGLVGRIASGVFGMLLIFSLIGLPPALLVLFARSVGAYAIGLAVAAAFERPEVYDRPEAFAPRPGFARHFEHPWFTALAALAVSALPSPDHLVERWELRQSIREQEERDRAEQQRQRFAAAARECEQANDFWTFCGAVRALALSDDGHLAATVHEVTKVTKERWSTSIKTDRITLSLWSLDEKPRRLWRTDVPYERNFELSFSPDARSLALVKSGAVVAYRTADGSERLRVNDCSGSGGSSSVGAGFSPDGRTLAVAARGICLFDPDTGQRAISFSPPMCGHTFAVVAGGRIWTLCWGGPRAFDLTTGAELVKLAFPPRSKHQGAPLSLGLLAMAVTRDGRHVATIGEDDYHRSIACIWDAQSGALVRSFTLGMKVRRGAGIVVFGSPARVAVSDSYEKQALIYDLLTGKLVDSRDARYPIGALAAAHDGSRVVLGLEHAPYSDPDRPAPAPWPTIERWKLWH